MDYLPLLSGCIDYEYLNKKAFDQISDVLDGKEISETSRRFLHSWHDAREVQKKRREEHLRKGSGEFRDSKKRNKSFLFS